MIRVFVFVLMLLYGVKSPAQVEVKNGFLADSVKVGSPVKFFLAARYPAGQNIIFPDSSYNFSPFELVKKIYSPTITINQNSYDSAVYELVTFEVKDFFVLSLPVFHIQARDTLVYYPPPDTIWLQHTVKELPPDTVALSKLALKTNTTPLVLAQHFNYLLAALVLLVSGFIMAVLWLLFGKHIKRYLRKRKLRQSHLLFSREFTTRLGRLKGEFRVSVAEETVALWKKYMEGLTGKPLTRLTTQEIRHQLTDEQIFNALRQLDQSIYGHGNMAVQPLEMLQTKANEIFMQKLQEVSHG